MHGLCKDLTGQRFGKLVVTKYYPVRSENRNRYYCDCKCDCGNTITVLAANLKHGKTHCGCESNKHGLSKTRIYQTWIHMKQRCHNKNSTDYKNYGGRGIFVCDEWRSNFLNFYNWAMDNGYSENLTIERIDVNKGYSPDNCTWIPMEEQSNNKQKTIRYTINGETKTAKDWAKIYNIPLETLHARVGDYGMKPEEAVLWKKQKKQYSKLREHCRKYDYFGENLTLKEISERTGIPKNAIYSRIHVRGWEPERAFTEELKVK